MTRLKNQTVLFNTPIKSSTVMGNGRILEEFEPTVTMSTYLVAFVLSDFKGRSKVIQSKLSKKNITISVYAVPEKYNQTEYALNAACQIIDYFERLFSIPYPLNKLDLVAIPDFDAGAMENWGLILYRETAILYDPKTTTQRDKQWIVVVIAHEISHQWFGNLVTMSWWDELWLNEGFATFMEFYGTNATEPSWNMMDSFSIDVIQVAMDIDRSRFSHPIVHNVQTPTEISATFDGITYKKGASVIAMVAKYVGDNYFFEGIKSYLNKYAYKNTVKDDLIQEIVDAAPDDKKNIKNILTNWVEKSGFPIISVALSKDKITLTQSRYIELGAETFDDDETIWSVPITYIFNNNDNLHSVLLQDKSTSVAATDDLQWIKLNFNRMGYYIVDYDEALFTLLTKQLKSDHTVFSQSDRSDIIHGAFMSANTGKLKYFNVFKMLEYLPKETDALPFKDAMLNLKKIEMNLRFQFDIEAHTKLCKFMMNLLQNVYDKLAWKSEEGLDAFQIKLKTDVVETMCQIGHKGCIEKAMNTFNTWMTNKSYVINANDKVVVFRTGIQHGGQASFDYVWDQYQTNSQISDTDKQLMLKQLVQTPDMDNADMLLVESIKGTVIRSQDFGSVFKFMCKTTTGTTAAQTFFFQEYDNIIEKHPPGSFALHKAYKAITENIVENVKLFAITQFFKDKNTDDDLQVKQCLENARVKVAWVNILQKDVVQWLYQNVQ